MEENKKNKWLNTGKSNFFSVNGCKHFTHNQISWKALKNFSYN